MGRFDHYYLIKFHNEMDRDQVVVDGPWAVHGALFFLNYWRPSVSLSNMVVNRIQLWVQLHNFPVECIKQAAGYTIGEAVGEVIDVDSNDSYPRNIRFLRIRVCVSV